MSEKPQKRLVSKGQYAWSMTGRATLLSAAVIFASVGIFSLVLAVICAAHGWNMESTYGIISTVLVLLAFGLYRKERTVERVAPITKHTITLTPESTLVRPSALPPSQEQAELLRAAQYGKETPAEELLRATFTTRQDN
jgi:hypothetical protein